MLTKKAVRMKTWRKKNLTMNVFDYLTQKRSKRRKRVEERRIWTRL
jgi:hypothetical protein